MRVFVTGASGYVGVPLVRRLLAEGHEVRALQRPDTTRPVQVSGVTSVSGNVLHPAQWESAMDGCDAVIHLVGIIRQRKRDRITMDRVHRIGTALVVDAARRHQVPKFIHMSALGARPGAISRYHRSKWDAEELVRQSGLDFTIFRPSVIFGAGGPGPEFVGILADLVRRAPIVPMIGDGHFELQPVSIDTVCEAFTKALTEPASRNAAFELGGPQRISYRAILELLAEAQNKKFHTISIPVFVMKVLVPILESFPTFPLSRDQLTMLLEGNTCTSDTRTDEALGLMKVPFTV